MQNKLHAGRLDAVQSRPPEVHVLHPHPGQALIVFTGAWTMHMAVPDPLTLLPQQEHTIHELHFNTDELQHWDSQLVVFLQLLIQQATQHNIHVVTNTLPDGVQRLLVLSQASPHQQPSAPSYFLVTRLGKATLALWGQLHDLATFSGDILLAVIGLCQGKVPFRGRDFFYFTQVCGAESLPIVSLIAVLVGVILSFVGAVQLQMFGAQIYVANLVGLGMVMEMGALMSAVIIAGRIGAAYAAQLGTMQVNEEIDALRTMGISPVGFLVLPRMLALMLMLPLLCIYADIMGILGGSIIGITMLDLSLLEYLEQTRKTLTLSQCGQGLLKSAVFGVLIGFAGCLRGMQCGRSALAVGEATTSAMVTAIVLIVVSDSIITYILFG